MRLAIANCREARKLLWLRDTHARHLIEINAPE